MLPALLLHAAMPAPAPICRAASLALTLGDDAADFNGMSHAGTSLVLRNRGRRGCTVAPSPRILLLDARGAALPIVLTRAPSPTATMLLTPSAEASASLRWVSGEVFDRSRCRAAARIVVALPSGRITAPLTARVCSAAGTPARVAWQPFTRRDARRAATPANGD